jgi:FkbM family methyltransferase
MSSFVARAVTVLQQPKIGLEYAWWVAQKQFLSREPTLQVHGVTLGGFNGFSEYHTVAAAVSAVELAFLTSLSLTGDGVVLDVGANLGFFSLLIAKLDSLRPIYAFEPSPSTFKSLEDNVARNRLSSVTCFQMAIADHDGEVRFALKEHARANASIVIEDEDRPGTLPVASETLDTFCKRRSIGRIALLKVDVEGYETLVFKGASDVLTKVRPELIYFEVCPALTRAAGFDPAEPARMLADLGYELKRFGPGGAPTAARPEAVSEVLQFENWMAVPTAK